MNITYELSDAIALIRLNRPEKLNALTGAMLAELGERFETIKRDSNIRAVILTGAGEKAFSAGTNIKELASVDAKETEEVARRVQKVCALIESCGVPTIA